MIFNYSDESLFVESAVSIISRLANQAIKERGRFIIVLTGGETPKIIYHQLRELTTDWSAWEFYISDERYTPGNDSQLNQRMIRNELLDHIPVHEQQIHFPDCELEMADTVETYNKTVKNTPIFDLTLIGIGEDGHVASLFPGNELGSNSDCPDVLAVYNSPKPPSQRITLSANRLCRSNAVLLIASGERKKEIVNSYTQKSEMPAREVFGLKETILLYCRS